MNQRAARFRRYRPYRLACGFLLLIALPGWAAQVDSLSVEHADGVYQIKLVAELAVPATAAWQVFTDFPNLKQVNGAIQQTRVLKELSGNQVELETSVRVCVWFYCRLIKQVQHILLQPGGESKSYSMQASILPEQSDFKSGAADWSFVDCNRQTCLKFAASLEPKFWVPPVIGPWLIRRKLEAEAMETSVGIEQAAIRLIAAKSSSD